MEVSINGDTRGYRIPLNGWFMMENPVKIDDLEGPPFEETSILCVHTCVEE